MYSLQKNAGKCTLSLSVLLVLGLYSLNLAQAEETRLKVAYMSPVALDHPFWGQIVSFMQAVAEDLNIDLEIAVQPEDNRFVLKKTGMKLIKSANPPDYLINSYYPDVTVKLIEAAKKQKIGVFVFNANLSEEDSKTIGMPRERFDNWIGHMYPDGTQAGFLLADILLKQANATRSPASAVKILALRGREPSDVYSRDWRSYGLKRRVGSRSDSTLVGNVACDWSRDLAKENATKLLTKNPGTRVIWAASDLMALGAVEAVKAVGKEPGKDVLLGGFDWAPEALQAISKGEMAVSLGGHFMEAGWALILLHDYHHGIDFKVDLGTQILTSMQAITADNVQQYLSKFKDQNWNKIDFKRFSKKYNPALRNYDFSLDALLK